MRRLLAAALIVGTLLFPAVRAEAASPGPATVQLLAQTPWLQGKGVYSLQIGLPGAAASDRLEVTIFQQVRTRTSFQSDAQGHVNDYIRYQQVVPVSDLPYAGGHFSVQLPVNQAPPAGDGFGTVQMGDTGVFPLQVALFDSSGTPVGTPLTTFIVYALPASSAGTLEPLKAAFVIPVSSPPVVSPSGGLGPPPASEITRLGRLAAALSADSDVPASLLASPLTLDEVGSGSSAPDRSVLASLNGAAAGGPFEILPSTYSPVSLGALQSQLPGEIAPQLDTASATLRTVFGSVSDGGTWVVDGPLDGATLDVLIAHGAKRLIVPDGDLTALPAEIQITYAGSTFLDYGGSQLQVVSADRGLTADFTRDEPPVLAANQLLAELAMIYSEAPNPLSPRGLAVMPPAGWSASPQFVETLLKGLQHNPLVSAVSASGLFSALGASRGVRYLSSKSEGAPLLDPVAAASIAKARVQIDDLKQVLPGTAQISILQKQLLLAESDTLSAGERQAVLGSIRKWTAQVLHVASLPPATAITLTSTQGLLPLTILAAPNVHPRVRIELRSQKLIFRPFSPRGGKCTIRPDGQETCTLTLLSQNTTLKVPVETRSSGVFPLDVYLWAGSQPLGHDQNTVRSTAVSGAAVIVIIVALAGLVLWWGRDLRRNRRPKGMVPSPLSDPGGDGTVTAGDPEVDGFFERPPPDFGPGAMSPSGAGAGPSKTTDTHGRGRETRKQ